MGSGTLCAGTVGSLADRRRAGWHCTLRSKGTACGTSGNGSTKRGGQWVSAEGEATVRQLSGSVGRGPHCHRDPECGEGIDGIGAVWRAGQGEAFSVVVHGGLSGDVVADRAATM